MHVAETGYSLQPRTTESVLPELPTLQPNVTVPLLRRVWFATPSDKRQQLATLFDSRVLVAGRAKALRLLTLDEVERAIGAVTPRYVVRFYDPRRAGVQVQTFVVEADADKFASERRLYGRPAVVLPIR